MYEFPEEPSVRLARCPETPFDEVTLSGKPHQWWWSWEDIDALDEAAQAQRRRSRTQQCRPTRRPRWPKTSAG